MGWAVTSVMPQCKNVHNLWQAFKSELFFLKFLNSYEAWK